MNSDTQHIRNSYVERDDKNVLKVKVLDENLYPFEAHLAPPPPPTEPDQPVLIYL